ncbi:hypothetical protein BJ165DRAFT_1518116 [Panaeolus papilionaceus]|nr:hypothetical protein BJ165DRAFT_1518116 [Panaeolus papilionaceus]
MPTTSLTHIRFRTIRSADLIDIMYHTSSLQAVSAICTVTPIIRRVSLEDKYVLDGSGRVVALEWVAGIPLTSELRSMELPCLVDLSLDDDALLYCLRAPNIKTISIYSPGESLVAFTRHNSLVHLQSLGVGASSLDEFVWVPALDQMVNLSTFTIDVQPKDFRNFGIEWVKTSRYEPYLTRLFTRIRVLNIVMSRPRASSKQLRDLGTDDILWINVSILLGTFSPFLQACNINGNFFHINCRHTHIATWVHTFREQIHGPVFLNGARFSYIETF